MPRTMALSLGRIPIQSPPEKRVAASQQFDVANPVRVCRDYWVATAATVGSR